MKIYLTAIIKAKPEFKTEVLALLNNMVIETRKEKACIQYDLHEAIDDENTFVFYEIWKNKQGLDLHNNQHYIKAFGAIIDEKLQEQPLIILTKLI